ncbi:O-methylsterigmatocystin oxidoreductase [Rhizoctonia solani]|uniref:O-methylsterigmatocystin oxidoreductase n=1 Tax=Rhizoctonia solani TaxID=456999 RepID=A0A0K6FUS9_9AGAM|nr:O-methylsterigmatocystin oxidoreductase [Rhizoctonia solani]
MTGPREALYTTLALVAPALLWHYYRTRSDEQAPHPPSPMSLPLIGSVLSLPSGPEHIMYTKLGKQLNSDIVYLNLFGHEIIVLNSSEAASDLLEKRSALYSDRFCPLILKEKDLLDWSTAPTILGYNDVWRHHRRMMNKWLNVREVTQFYKLQENQARVLLQRLLRIPTDAAPFDQVRDEFFFAMASSVFQATYGYTPQEKDDPFLRAGHESIDHGTEAVMVTNFFVNIIPALNLVPEWFPGAGWKRVIREWRKQKEYAQGAPYQWTQNQVSQGTNEPSILGTLLQDHELVSGLTPEEKEDRLKQLAFILYSGGFGTND